MVTAFTSLSLLLSGLAYAENPELARVYVYRYKQFLGSTFEPSVYRDEVRIARMDNGRYFHMDLLPGKYTLRSNDQQSGLEIHVVPGQEYFVRVDMATGLLKERGRLSIIPREQGVYEISKLKKLDPDKILAGAGISKGETPFDEPAGQVVQKTGILTNADVLTLKSAGMGDDVVIKKINASIARFSLEPSDLISLKRSGVSEKVLGAMLDSVK